jgi:hypothetical protein
MKWLSVKQLMVMVFIGLLTMSGAALGDEPPGNGPATGSENEMGQGDQERSRDGSCDELLGVMGQHDGPGCGDGLQHKYGQDDDVFGLESCCEGDANQYRQQQQNGR